MHIGPTRLLKVGPPNTEYNLKGRLHEEYTSTDKDDNSEIKAMVANNNKNDDKEDPQE